MRAIAAVAAVSSCSVLALLVADRLLRGTGILVRLVAAAVTLYWCATWGFAGLGLAGWFRLSAVVPLFVILPTALLIWRRGAVIELLIATRAELRSEARELIDGLRAHPWVSVGLGAVTLHFVFRAARVIATPAFGWDDFTYHLFRAGRWVQGGGIVLEPAPDAWSYYDFYPWGGDLIWAWALVWRLSDLLVPLAALSIWFAVLLAAYALARELGQRPWVALLVSLALASLPSQIGQLHTAYVDNAVLFLVLVASLFVLRLGAERSGERRALSSSNDASALVIGASCGLGLLVKTSFLPILAAALAIVVWQAVRGKRAAVVWTFGLGASVVVPNLWFNTLHRGSPFYPFRILEALPYNEQLAWILGRFGWTDFSTQAQRGLKALVVNISPQDPFLNVGWLGVLLLVLGVAGAWKFYRRTADRIYLFWLLAGAVITVFHLFDPRNSSMVTWWANVMGRFLVPSLAGLLVLAAISAKRILRTLLLPVLVVEYFIYAPWAWPAEILLATLKVLGLILAVTGVAVGLARTRVRVRTVVAWLVPLISASMVASIGIREAVRYDAFRLFSEGRVDDFHRAPPARAWPLWQWLDAQAPCRVAATAGFDGITGHNWFRWPLLGSRLQHEVIYVPITADGSIVDYAQPGVATAAADREAWLARLAELRIDRVAALAPAHIEHQWILELTDIFAVEISLDRNNWILARVESSALSRHLSAAKS